MQRRTDGPCIAPDDVDDDFLSGRRLQVVVGHTRIDRVDDAHGLIHLRLRGRHFHLRYQPARCEGQFATLETWADRQAVERVEEGHTDLAHGGRPHHVLACGQTRRDRIRRGAARARNQTTTRELLDATQERHHSGDHGYHRGHRECRANVGNGSLRCRRPGSGLGRIHRHHSGGFGGLLGDLGGAGRRIDGLLLLDETELERQHPRLHGDPLLKRLDHDLLQEGIGHLLEDARQGTAPGLRAGDHPVERTAEALADAIPQRGHFIDGELGAIQLVAPRLHANHRIRPDGLRSLLHGRQQALHLGG